MQLHSEAFSLPEALLDHVLEAKLVTKEGEALPEQLTAEQFKSFAPQLDKKKLRFWMILHKQAFEAFKASGFDESKAALRGNSQREPWQLASFVKLCKASSFLRMDRQ